jgi:hypothetical protein
MASPASADVSLVTWPFPTAGTMLALHLAAGWIWADRVEWIVF